MKTELVDVSETRKNLSVEIPSDVVDAEIARVASRYGKTVKLPGFRPGKVPARVVRQRFKGQILHDVAHALIDRAVGEALVEKGVEPVDSPDIRDVKLAEGHSLTFTAEFDVVPPFDPGDLSTIEVRRSTVAVEDEAVRQALERLRERAARFEPVEGGIVEPGHTIIVDLERQALAHGAPTGEPERHERATIELGAKANPPGFDDEVAGLAVGGTRDFTVRYPDDYAVRELAGTSARFRVTVHEIRRRVVPALDDEFAKDLGEFESLEALTARVRDDLEAEAREASDRQLRADVLKKLAERVPFPVPASLIDREVDRRVEDFAHRLMEQRIDPRQTNIDWAAFREGQRAPATDAVAGAIVLDEIARRDEVRVTDAEIDQELARLAERAGRTPAAVRAHFQQEGTLGRLAAGIRREKTVAHVLSRVRIIEA
ncbi:MAG: trigger factor [Acidobacteriota bacterium]